MKFRILQHAWPLLIMAILAFAAVTFRPLLPIDETRYMTVAWEMRQHSGWLSPLTMNFAPYHHKPPLLFWLINASWSLFGISRWASIIPIALASFAVVILTAQLGKKITRAVSYDFSRLYMLCLGSLPFLIYSTFIMFDVTLTAFVLASLLCLLQFADIRQTRYIILMALFTGLGVLTKGPVAYLYIIFPLLLAPIWIPSFSRASHWYSHVALWLFLSTLPVLLWLIPVLQQSDNHFAFWLVWEQTAGRITGNFNDAHVRPFYFYLPLVLILFMPWIFFPNFWQSIKTITWNNEAIKFIGCWFIPTFLSFCLISGKQPHYLLPLLPAILLLTSLLLQDVQIKVIVRLAIATIMFTIIGQFIASKTLFKSYDLRPIATYMAAHEDKDWAYARNYHGEFGFLARMSKPVEDIPSIDALNSWFTQHPDGYAIIRYKKNEEVAKYTRIMSHQYRGKNIGIFKE